MPSRIRPWEKMLASQGARASVLLEDEIAPSTTRRDSRLLRFVQDLRASLDEDEPMHQEEPVESQSKLDLLTTRNDSVMQTPDNTRKRRYSFHPSLAAKRDLAATRADVNRIVRTRNMSRAEISLRREMFYQEQYLRAHKRDGGTVAYRQMAVALTRNQRHMLMYKRRGSEWRDLPVELRNRIWELAVQVGDGGDGMAVNDDAGMPGTQAE